MTTETVYNLEDFFTATLNDKPAPMPLLLNGKETGQSLFVLGSESTRLKRAISAYRKSYSELLEEAKGISDKFDQDELIIDKTSALNLSLASEMVTGTSFGNDDKENAIKILTENKGLSQSVVAFSFDNGNYLKKK